MKKLLTTAFCFSVIALGMQGVMAQDCKDSDKPPCPPFEKQFHKKQKPPMVNFDEVLQLTDKQKAQAKANRIKSRKEMKPIMDSIRDKREAIMDVIDSDLSKEQQQAKIKAIEEEIKVLEQKANTIRKQNMQDFEKILTKEQKNKLEEFKKQHKPPMRKQPPCCKKNENK